MSEIHTKVSLRVGIEISDFRKKEREIHTKVTLEQIHTKVTLRVGIMRGRVSPSLLLHHCKIMHLFVERDPCKSYICESELWEFLLPRYFTIHQRSNKRRSVSVKDTAEEELGKYWECQKIRSAWKTLKLIFKIFKYSNIQIFKIF